MADDTDDILNDLDEDFDDDMEDILDGSSLSESDESDDSDSFDSYDLDQDEFDEDISDGDPPVKKRSSKKNVISKITEKIPKKFKSKKILIIIGGAMVLFLVVVIALLIFVFGGKSKQNQDLSVSDIQSGENSANLVDAPVDEIIFEDIVALEPFERMHLKTSSTKGLITLNLSLELTDHRYRKQIVVMDDRIRKIVVTQVAEMTWLELRNPEGKIRLKYDLLKRFNSLFSKTTVRNVFFTYFIMQ